MKIEKILSRYLLVGSIYLILDGLVHVLNIKMTGVFWPEASLVYGKFIGSLYGLMAILVGLIGIEASKNLEKYKNLLYIVAIWGFFYSGNLIYTSLTTNFIEVFNGFPSVYVWMPFYNGYLIFEAGLVLILSALIFLWLKNK